MERKFAWGGLTGRGEARHFRVMNDLRRAIGERERLVVGSVGTRQSLDEIRSGTEGCDVIEVRLDLWDSEGVDWSGFGEKPLLFTARRAEEGGAEAWSPQERERRLFEILNEASCVDVEVASIPEMGGIIQAAMECEIPWVASFHDFQGLPAPREVADAAKQAREAGAAVFKLAARLDSPAEMAWLAEFQLADHGIAVATMGMGPLAPVSRLLCAQCGSVLNYGYVGEAPTAPGQWDAETLGHAIRRLAKFPG